MPDPASILAGRTVVQIVPELDAGGVERTAVDVAAALTAVGARAVVLSQGGRLEADLLRAGGMFRPFPAATKNPFRILVNARRLAAILREEDAAILHARSRAPAWSALMAARATRTPLVTTWAGAYSAKGRAKKLYNSVMARGDAVIANSNWTARRILADHPEAAPRLTAVHRGTDLARFDPARIAPEVRDTVRAAWGLAPETRAVLVAARLTGWKGHRTAIEALSLLPPEVAMVFAGDAQGRDAYVEELRALAARLGVAARLVIAGHQDDMAATLAAADAVAVPSTEPEAFGRAAVEAQAMGLPVVVSDHGAAPETVIAEAGSRTGWRVPPGDAAALACALREVFALPPGERAALAVRARAQAERFSLKAMTDATLAVYARLIAGG